MVVPKILNYEVELRAVIPKENFQRPPVVYTNDLRSAEFRFLVTDMEAGDLSEATATTLLYMRDGSFFQNPKEDVILDGTTFSYTLKENEGNHAGIAKIQLVVTIPAIAPDLPVDYASQLYEFEIANGLETKVAPELMIQDWTTLTRDARAYIDQFVADEMLREAEFDNNQFDRNAAFVNAQDARTLAFGTEQTDRGTAFTAEQNERTTAFNESESGRTTAETGRVTAEDGRVIAENNRVTKEGQRVTAETNRVTAEGNRVTAESGRVTAENARVTAETNRAAAFTAFDTRLLAEETATAANKISAVKGKTFSDVDARFEDVEADTTMMGTNLVTNGDFSNGTTGWVSSTSAMAVTNGKFVLTPSTNNGFAYEYINAQQNDKLYISGINEVSGGAIGAVFYNGTEYLGGLAEVWLSAIGKVSQVIIMPLTATRFMYRLRGATASIPYTFDNIFAINLTAAFGVGNEPTTEQMDGIMAKFANSWFDGTKNLYQAKASLSKLMALDARTEFEAKNAVVNGDLSQGTTGWEIYSLTPSIAVNGDYLEFTPTTTSGAVAQSFICDPTHKYYFRFTIKVSAPTTITAGFATSGVATSQFSKAANTTDTLITEIHQPSQALTKLFFGKASAAVTVSIKKYVTVIDLTATFGAGKEPTLAEMDRLMARFPNSWFDGVKPVQTIETLYQEKANKVQENWITPTLTNGWTEASGYKVRYMKDEFGFVHLKGRLTGGTLSAAAFTLPAGYRPLETLFYPLISSGAFGAGFINSSGAVTPSVGSNVNVQLDGITFRAEV